MDDLNPQRSSDESQADVKPSLLKRAQLKIQSFLSIFQTTPSKKMIITGALIAVLILVGGILKFSSSESAERSRAANKVLAQALAMVDIKKYIGTALMINGDISGPADSKALNADLSFPVHGEKGNGQLDAVLTNGKLTTLTLTLPQGRVLNVMQDEVKAQADAAAKVAQEAKAIAMENAFKVAVQAYNDKNYSQALEGFQQSIKNDYEVASSHEYIGFIYSQTGQYQLCVTELHKFLDLESDSKESYYQLAYCYLQLYDTGNAVANLQQSCQLGYSAACDAVAKINNQQISGNVQSPTVEAQTPAASGAAVSTGAPVNTALPVAQQGAGADSASNLVPVTSLMQAPSAANPATDVTTTAPASVVTPAADRSLVNPVIAPTPASVPTPASTTSGNLSGQPLNSQPVQNIP